ncbi:hypothetical protein FRC11_002255 [Ceratobasidium sp. 423]|nr:hypothetical protein FRC11_002255 [Ceratobasidium sp. 423]
MEALSTGEGPSAGSQVPTPTMNDDTTTGLSHTSVLVETIATPNGGVDASAQRSQGPMYLILPGDVIGYSDPPVFSLYMSLMAHYRLIKHQFSALAPGHTRSDISQVPSFLIRELSHFKQQRSYYEPIIVRIARQKIERFRGIALEFARTVPIGVLDQMDIDQHDWETMQWFMMGSINSWLAPLERKLDGLEENTVPDQKLQAQFGWLGKERKYLWKDYTMVVPSN